MSDIFGVIGQVYRRGHFLRRGFLVFVFVSVILVWLSVGFAFFVTGIVAVADPLELAHRLFANRTFF